MPALKAFVVNCLMGGDEVTVNGSSWTRDIVKFNCNGLTLTFRQNKDVISGSLDKFKGQCIDTTEVLIENVEEKDIQRIRSTLDKICWLLSFAGLSRVICYGHEYPSGSGFTKLSSVSGIASYFRPTIDISNGTTVKNFVNQSYENYSKLEELRKLNVVIHYLLLAEDSKQPIEARLVLAFIILESLKSTYAKSKNILYKGGAFRKPAIELGGKEPVFHFGELLGMMLREVGMTIDLKEIASLRNEIIHSGISEQSYSWQWSMYEKIHDLIREYLIRLLGYDGEYLTYSSASNEVRKIAQVLE